MRDCPLHPHSLVSAAQKADGAVLVPAFPVGPGVLGPFLPSHHPPKWSRNRGFLSPVVGYIIADASKLIFHGNL